MIPRRAALERLSLLLGGALSPQITASLVGQVLNEGERVAVTPEQTALLAEIADVIIPTTDTPGAKAAGVEAFIIRVLRDCYVLEEQQFLLRRSREDRRSGSAGSRQGLRRAFARGKDRGRRRRNQIEQSLFSKDSKNSP